jgi:proteasome lid subunit RPN8/RPN11
MKPPYPDYVLDRIRSLASQSPTEEIGGVTLATPGAYRVYPIHNCSLQADVAYIPHTLGLLDSSKLGHLEFYWHTHVNGNPNFSPTDITGIWETAIPWLLYDLKNDSFNFFDPDLRTPLLAREWELGLTDCWSLVRDFYRWHLDIILPPPEHDGRLRPWLFPDWNRALDLLPNHFDRVPIQTVEPYDLVLYKNSVENANPGHFGVLLPTVNGLELLHHFYKRSSALEPIPQPDRIHSIWRSKCPISPSNYSVLWGVDSDKPTNLKPPDLTKVSVIFATNSTNSSNASWN